MERGGRSGARVGSWVAREGDWSRDAFKRLFVIDFGLRINVGSSSMRPGSSRRCFALGGCISGQALEPGESFTCEFWSNSSTLELT